MWHQYYKLRSRPEENKGLGVSHAAPIGGIQVFANHTHKNKCKQNVPTISARRAAFHACLSLCSDRSIYTPSKPYESQLFWSWEKPEYPQVEPYARIKMGGFWDLGSISVVVLEHIK